MRLIDELIAVSNLDNIKKDNANHPHDKALRDWKYYKTYFQDFDGKYYEVTISAMPYTQDIAYDIGNFIKRKFPTNLGSSSQKQEALNGELLDTNSISQNPEIDNGKNASGGGMYSQQMDLYSYDGESAKSRGIRKKAVDELADNLGRRFGITGKIGKEGMRKEEYRIADKVEKLGYITKADMDNFFDAAVQAARTIPCKCAKIAGLQGICIEDT